MSNPYHEPIAQGINEAYRGDEAGYASLMQTMAGLVIDSCQKLGSAQKADVVTALQVAVNDVRPETRSDTAAENYRAIRGMLHGTAVAINMLGAR